MGSRSCMKGAPSHVESMNKSEMDLLPTRYRYNIAYLDMVDFGVSNSSYNSIR
jgi:hypothetical protein